MNILGLRSGSSRLDGDQSHGDIRFFSKSAFEARFKHIFEFGWGQIRQHGSVRPVETRSSQSGR